MKLENNLEELDMSFNTLFGKVPEDWTISKIGDIAELRQGLQIASKKRLQSQELGSIPLLKITDLPRKVFSEYVKDIPENYIATKEDIIYTRTGQVGLVYTDVEGCVHNNCFKVILDYNKFDKKYMYYYLNSPQVREYANIIASGSVQKDLTHKAFKIVKVAYPSLKEQKAIADILSSLDEKIELNNQMNETLEEMAQALFKRWFVDFEFPNGEGQPYKSSGGEMVESELGMIPKGWKVVTLDEIIATISVKHSFNKEELIFLNTSDILNGEVLHSNYSSVRGLPGQAKKSIQQDDILYSEIRPQNKRFAYVNFDASDYVVSTKLMVLRAKGIVHPKLIYLFLTNEKVIEHLQMIAESRSGTFPQITFKELSNIKLNVPLGESLSFVESSLISLINKIFENKKENRELIEIRDALLPKLMSGEIRVSDLES